MIKDADFSKLVEEQKQFIHTDMSAFTRFLAYTHDGPDDVEVWNGKKRFKKLRNTPIWKLLVPARAIWHGMQFLYVHGVKGLGGKIKHKIHDNKWTRRKAARAFLAEIMPSEEECKRQREETFSIMPKMSVLVPLYNTPEKFLRDMIESVMAQTYANWELCLADASDDMHGNVAEIVREYVSKDSRIAYQKLEKNGGIADNTNECIKMATGDYLGLFDHDDMLHPSVLYECAKVINTENAEFVYTDELTFMGEDLEDIQTYHFKPDFSVDNLRGVNYICHFSVFKKTLVDEVGMFSKDYDGSQDHDIIMRLTDAAKVVSHVPKILYFWRCHKNSTSMNIDSKSYAIDAGRRAVRDAEIRRGYPAKVTSAQICKTHYRMEYKIANPYVTILIDARKADIKTAAKTAASIELCSTYTNYEIKVVTSDMSLKEQIKQADASYIVMLCAGAEIITDRWIEELLMFAQRTDVGVCGMQILDADKKIYSSDMIFGKTAEHLALEVNRGESFDAPGYMGRNYYAHNVSLISGMGCMARKGFFDAYLKDFDNMASAMISYCFEVRKAGYEIVVNPYALMMQMREDAVSKLDEKEQKQIFDLYKEQIEKGDPFYNPNFSFERFWQKG